MPLVLVLFACKHETEETPPPAPIACGKEDAIAVDGTCLTTGVPEGACAPGFVWKARACEPSLPASCPPNTIAVLGETECHPVGVDKCADGFAADGEGGCAAVLPKTTCAAGQMALPGETTCADVDVCDPLPPDAKGTYFVDPAATTGGDGSKGAPFSTIAAALGVAIDGDKIVLADGSYPGGLVVDKAVTLKGRCASKVEIAGTDPAIPVVSLRSGSALEHLSVTGSGRNAIEPSGTTSLSFLRIHDVSGRGVFSTGGANAATVRHVLIESATTAGIEIAGGKLTLEDVIVRDTRPLGDGTAGFGVSIGMPSGGSTAPEMIATRILVERNADQGMLLHGANVTLVRSVVRDTKPRGDGTFGFGLNVLAYSDPKTPRGNVTIRDSIVSGNTTSGIVIAGSVANLERVTVRDTVTSKLAAGGRGLVIQGHPVSKLPGEVTVRRSVINRNFDAGVIVASSKASFDDCIMRETRILPKHDECGGLFVIVDPALKTPGQATVTTSLVEGNDDLGVGTKGGALTIVGSTVRTTRTVQPVGGWGVHGNQVAGDAASITLKSTIIEDVAHLGVFTFNVPLTMEGCLVRREKALLSDPTSAACVIAAGTLAEVASPLTIRSSVFEDCEDLGVAAIGTSGSIESTTIRRVLPRGTSAQHGVALVVYPSSTGLDGSAKITTSTISESKSAAIWLGDARLDVTGSLIRNVTVANDTKTFGDGIMVGTYVARSFLHLERSAIVDVARAGVSVFGSDAEVSETRFSCAAFDLDIESAASGAPALADLGGNVCGCETRQPCRGQTANLAPLVFVPK